MDFESSKFLIVVVGGGSLHVLIIWFPRCIIILLLNFCVQCIEGQVGQHPFGGDGLTCHPNRSSSIPFPIPFSS